MAASGRIRTATIGLSEKAIKREAREVGREPEEQRLAERQESRLPPAQADADRGDRIEA